MHLRSLKLVLLIGGYKKHNLQQYSFATLTLDLGLYCATLFDYAIYHLRDTNGYREPWVTGDRLCRK